MVCTRCGHVFTYTELLWPSANHEGLLQCPRCSHVHERVKPRRWLVPAMVGAAWPFATLVAFSIKGRWSFPHVLGIVLVFYAMLGLLAPEIARFRSRERAGETPG